MKLSVIFNHLTFGELKQFGVGGYEDYKAIQPENYQEIVNHLNLGMLNLFTRFPISEKEFIFTTELSKTLYPLPEDCLRLNSVYVNGEEIPLNDEFVGMSAFTSSYNQVQLPFATGSEEISFIYRSEPEVIIGDTLDEEVALPESLLEALLAHVEFRVRKSLGGVEGMNLAAAAKQNYEMLCAEVEKRNVLNNADATTNIKPSINGWV